MENDNFINVDLLSEEEKAFILKEVDRRLKGKRVFDSTEDLLTEDYGFGLHQATPLQRAICRIVDGKPLGELGNLAVVHEALGTEEPLDFLDGVAPPEVIILAAVRTAKSMIMAARAIVSSQTCPVDHLGPGEIPRYSILSLEKDNAKVVHAHLLGLLKQPELQHLRLTKQDMGPWRDFIDEVGADTVGSEFIWAPCGRPVEVRIVCGKRGGGSLVSRWCLGVAFDEAPRMMGQNDAVVNLDEAYQAVRSRLLPGAQILQGGSPWQPYGPIFDKFQEGFGLPKPTRIIIRGKGPDLNPTWWTPERCAELKNDPKNAVVYQTDVLAEFADVEQTMFPQIVLNRCCKQTEWIPYDSKRDFCAAMDPATRNNAWTLVIADRIGVKKRIVAWKEWQGTSVEPLSPKVVLQEATNILALYNLTDCYTDQWSADANRDLAFEMGLNLVIEDWKGTQRTNAYQSMAVQAALEKVDLPRDPMVRKDLSLVKRRVTPNGISIHLPATSDGRHCDYAAAIARVLFRWLNDEQEVAPDIGEPGYDAHLEKEMVAREQAHLKKEHIDVTNAAFTDRHTEHVIAQFCGQQYNDEDIDGIGEIDDWDSGVPFN